MIQEQNSPGHWCRIEGQEWQSGEGLHARDCGIDLGSWEEHGCFPQPQLLLESECSQCKGQDFVEVDTILEKAFTCHMHENLTGFSLSPAWNKSTDVTSFKFLCLAVKLTGFGWSVSVAGKGKVRSSHSLMSDWVNAFLGGHKEVWAAKLIEPCLSPWGHMGPLSQVQKQAPVEILSSPVQAVWDKGWCCFPWTLSRRVEPSVSY